MYHSKDKSKLDVSDCKVFVEGDKMLGKCLDHDHVTGKPRGIVCGRVNLVMGQAEEIAKSCEYSAAEILVRMNLYLKGQL